MRDRRKDQRLGRATTHAGQDDDAGVDVAACGKGAEVPGVLGDDHQVFLGASFEHDVIRVSEAAVVARMDDEVTSVGGEIEGEPRGEAFVEKQPHARQGLPLAGRPRGGCARA